MVVTLVKFRALSPSSRNVDLDVVLVKLKCFIAMRFNSAARAHFTVRRASEGITFALSQAIRLDRHESVSGKSHYRSLRMSLQPLAHCQKTTLSSRTVMFAEA